MGFRNVKAFNDAHESGRNWMVSFRKAVAAANTTVAGHWYDYSYAGGNPIANYYASAPLEAATLDSKKGIWVPRMSGDETQWIHRWGLMSLSASATSVTNGNQGFRLLDYVMYYPFVDGDSTDLQEMTNDVTLPRYEDGAGLEIMAVCQAATIGGGIFTVNYTDANDVARVSGEVRCHSATVPPGALMAGIGVAGAAHCFIPLAADGNGVKSIQSVTFSVANGGLMALVIVRPLWTTWLREESRRTTTGTLESFGDSAEREIVTSGVPVEIKDGAFLGFIGKGSFGSLASSVVSGMLETVWS